MLASAHDHRPKPAIGGFDNFMGWGPRPVSCPDNESVTDTGSFSQPEGQTPRFFRRKDGTVYRPKGSLNFSGDGDPVPVFLSRQ